MSPALLIVVGFLFILLMSMVLHEYAHGYVANLCGDYTAEAAGRLTLNPLKHIDLFMTILLPVALLVSGSSFIFGGAKPVPVNPYNFRRLRLDSRLVSAAGVVTNLTIAVGLAIVLHLTLRLGIFTVTPGNPTETSPGVIVLGMGIIFNLILFAFNLVPIPPLDGSRILRSYLPAHMEAIFNMLDPYGIIIIFILFAWSDTFSMIVGAVVGIFWHYVLLLDWDYIDLSMEGFRLAWRSLIS